jgi:hypothetical protein
MLKPEENEERIEVLLAKSRARHTAPVKLGNSVEAIRAYLNDYTDSVILTDEQEMIYARWKEIYRLKMEGKTVPQIVAHITRLWEVSEKTVRLDLRQFARVFPPQFDADFEMQVLYNRAQEAYNKFSRSTDVKLQAIAQKYLETMHKCIVWFKENANTPRPEDLKPPTFILTIDPRDIGIEDEVPDIDALMRKYIGKRKYEKAEAIDYEPGGN